MRTKARRRDSGWVTFGRRSFLVGMMVTVAARATAADLSAADVRALLESHTGPGVPDLSGRDLAGLDSRASTSRAPI